MILQIEDVILVISTVIIGLAFVIPSYRLVKWTFTGSSIVLNTKGTVGIGYGSTIKITGRIKQKHKCNFKLYWQKIESNNKARNITFCNTIKYYGTKSKTLAPVFVINKAEKEDAGIYQLKYESNKEVVISAQISIQVSGDTADNSISVEKNNFMRYVLLNGLGRDCVLQLFRHHVKENDLQKHLNTWKCILRQQCQNYQIDVLFPQTGNVRSADFDFSLLYTLLRNTLNLKPPTDGWFKNPKPGSILKADDIQRIRYHRNDAAHNSTQNLPKKEFNNRWNDLSKAINRLSNGNLTKEIKSLSQRTFDIHYENEYIHLLSQRVREIQNDLDSCRKELSDVQSNLAIHRSELSDVQLKLVICQRQGDQKEVTNHVPRHIRGNHIEILGNWKRNNSVFVKVKGFRQVLNMVQSTNAVIIIGGPGSGKTVTARSIALHLQEEGWEVVPVFKPEEINDYRNKRIKQLFVLDDFVGTFSLDLSLYDKIVQYITSMFPSEKHNTKVLLICRKSVYIAAVKKLQGLSSVKVIELESIENGLDNDEKRRILQKHCDTMSVPKKNYEHLSIENANIMFPFLCELFAGNEKFQSIGERFFRKPFEGLCMEFDIMQDRNTVHYAALIMCMISNNCLSIGRLLEEKTKVFLYNSVGLNQGTADRLLQDALEQMIGTYVIEIDDHFSFIHDSLFDILAYHYGRRVKYCPEMIRYLPSKCISNMVCVDSNQSVDEFSIQIPEDQFNSLAERLFTDIQNLKLYEVFMMKLLYHEPFVRAFIEMLNKESYDSLKSVFLSVQENATCEHPDHIDNMVHNLLADLAFFVFEEERYCIRVISWVVYFGHFQLLQYIMDRVHDEEGSYRSVFGSEKMEHTRLLVLCCYRINEKMTKLLLDHIDLDCINENLLTNNMLEIVPNAHRTHTPLTAACQVGNLPIVKLLVQSGPKINENDPNTLLSLSLARYYGHTEIVDFLLCNNRSQSTYITIGQPIDEHTVHIITCKIDECPSINMTCKSRTHLSGKDQQIERDIRDRKVNMKRKRCEKRKRENNQFCKARETVSSKSRQNDAPTQARLSQMVRWANREINNKSKQNFRRNSQGNSKISTKTTKSKTLTMQDDGDSMIRYLVKGNLRGNNRRRKQKEPKPKHSAAKKSRDYSC
ncbi:ANKRD50 [Mytilus coruscus]|uniref:ANKRD50 n=1 Tax=Mytilus coruscus TaxID=42192 RepID=A0A6J8BTU5_MYTCO|nr:ANKRD50 [Mytilus coruscus]